MAWTVLLVGALIGAAQQLPSRAPDIGYQPTAPEVADAMLKLAGVGADDVVYDLGSGDGRIVILAAQKYGARGVGVELQPGLVLLSRQAAVQAGVADKVIFIQGDLFDASISDATVVTLYLWPNVNKRLEAKLRRELRPGTRIVSHVFGIGSWVPQNTLRGADGTSLHLWTVPRPPAREPDVEFVPTPHFVADDMLRLANVGSSDVVYDLGSGDGRIAVIAAQKYGAEAVGIELDPSLVDRARQVAHDAGLSARVRFIEGDLFTADISPASVVTLFLSQNVNVRLEQKLRALRPGTRIVSRQFTIGSWTPDKSVRADDGTELFLWTVPPR